MSNRTIIEINHDLWHRIEKHPQAFVESLVRYLCSACPENREELERAGYGVAVLATVHHSTDVRVSFGKVT